MKKMICFSASFVGVFFLITSAWAYQPFLDTGQTKCYDNVKEITCPQPGQPFYGQDAQYPKIPRSYTKLGYGGAVLADNALHVDDGGPWIMTRDNITGLIWEVKREIGLQNTINTYTWYDPNAETNGGHEGFQDGGKCIGSSCDTHSYIQTLNAQNFGGYSDWRLPKVKELSSLVDRGLRSPVFDAAWFPKMMSGSYWSSNTDFLKTLAYNAYVVSSRGQTNKTVKGNFRTAHVRAVRGGNDSAISNFVDNGDGTVTDTVTGLMWQKETATQRYIWQHALEYTNYLTLAGYSDWRLPNINELQTLIDYSITDSGTPIFSVFKPHTASAYYWSSTSGSFSRQAWFVSFSGGTVAFLSKSSECHVRAVRTIHENVFNDLDKANIIFNWLESEFPEILSPTPQPTYESNGIYFRYYPGTNVYIGTIQNHLYFYDHLGVLHNLGSVDIWLPFAQGN